jgi:hypothetical protein
MSHWLIEISIWICDSFVSFFFYLCFIWRITFACLMVCRCGMAYGDEDHGRSRRPDAEDRGWSHRSGTRWSGGREVGWRRVRSAPGTWRLGALVSWLRLKTKVDGLWVVWPQNHSDGFHRFDLKTSGDGFLQFGLKAGGDGFFRFGLKTGGGFLVWASKPRWLGVSRFGPQNQQL